MVNSVRSFEVYIVDGKIYGYEITHYPYPRCMEGYQQSHFLLGKHAAFCIVANDGHINRAIAIRFAQAIFSNSFKTIRVDLKEINP